MKSKYLYNYDSEVNKKIIKLILNRANLRLNQL